MSHWLDLRKEQLVLEKVLHTEANQVLFTAHNSEEELYVYRGDLVLDQIELTKLHETPLSQWGAPGQSDRKSVVLGKCRYRWWPVH